MLTQVFFFLNLYKQKHISSTSVYQIWSKGFQFEPLLEAVKNECRILNEREVEIGMYIKSMEAS